MTTTEILAFILLAALAIAVLLLWRVHRALRSRVMVLEYREHNRREQHVAAAAAAAPAPSHAPPGVREHQPAPRTHTVVG